MVQRKRFVTIDDIQGKGSYTLFEMMLVRALENKDPDNPDHRAAIEADLMTAVDRIKDPTVKKHYRAAVIERLAKMFGGSAPPLPHISRKGSQIAKSPLAQKSSNVISLGPLLRGDKGSP